MNNFEPNFIIENKIRRDPYNKELYIEYARWLMENGQPEFSAFITNCCEVAYFPGVSTWDPVKNKQDEKAKSILANSNDLTGKCRKWRYGFVQNHLIPSLYNIEELDKTLQLPFFRFLESLTIAYEDLLELFKFLNNWEGLKHLKRLNIWDYDYYEGKGIEGFNLILPKLKDIQYLYLVGNPGYEIVKDDATGQYQSVEIEMNDLYLPGVVHFGRISTYLTKSELDKISNAFWPKLEALTIAVGNDSELVAEDFTEFLKGENLVSVKDLAIKNYVDMDNLLTLMLDSPLLLQLKRLSFYKSDLTTKGAQILLKNKDKFAHIEKINIWGTMLSEDDETKLVDTFPSIKSHNAFRATGEIPNEEMIYGEFFWEETQDNDRESFDPF